MVKRVDPISSSAQISLGLEGEPEQLQRKRPVDPGYREIHEKYNPPEKDPKGKAAENKEFEDKRQPKSDLIRQTEIARMKEILDKSKGGGGGGGGGSMTDPMERKTKPYNKAKGGIIKSSASKRADGCAIRGKTRA
jgi:hypothetical protein